MCSAHRFLLALVGGALVVSVATACAGDPIAGYLAEIRDAAAEAGLEQPTDAQALGAGEALCSDIGAGDTRAAGIAGTPVALVARAHCDLFPLSEEQRAEYGVAPASPAPALQTPQLSPRGAEAAQTGQRIEVWGPMAPSPVQYVTVSAIRPVTLCKGKDVGPTGALVPAMPENGRFLAVDMTIENAPGYDVSQAGHYTGTSQDYDWVAQDGAATDDVATLVAFYCSGTDEPFVQMKPGRTYKGTKYVDVPDGAGYLIFGQNPNVGPGYEFEVPAAS